MKPSGNRPYTLNRDCSLKLLEEPSIYNRATDELYEIDHTAMSFLKLCADGGATAGEDVPEDFLAYCLQEGILEEGPGSNRVFSDNPSPRPSLRYLEIQLTNRCNLRCRHCYLGEPAGQEMPLELAIKAGRGLDKIHGLRLLLSGGEPLLYKRFWELNELLPDLNLRVVLLSNGVLINEEVARHLKVQEVQVSLDGMEKAHDYLRGRGSFARACLAVENLLEAGIAVSIATMVYKENAADFKELEKLLDGWGIGEWNVDQPALAGRLVFNAGLVLKPREAAPLLEYARGGGYHGSGGDYACGTHLATVKPDGELFKCGFYSWPSGGNIRNGLKSTWLNLPRIYLHELKCECEFLQECKGGCRYRAYLAGDGLGPDPVQCARLGKCMRKEEGSNEDLKG